MVRNLFIHPDSLKTFQFILEGLFMLIVKYFVQIRNPRRNGGCLPKLTAYEKFEFFVVVKVKLQIRCQKKGMHVNYLRKAIKKAAFLRLIYLNY